MKLLLVSAALVATVTAFAGANFEEWHPSGT
jgi:hypothetical protein